MAFIRSQLYPISDGVIIAAIKAAFVSKGWGTGLWVATYLPETKTRRMVTVRDDSGTAAGRIQPRRQGINIWSDDLVEAKRMGLEMIRVAEMDLPKGDFIATTRGFVGPYEVDDETPFVVSGKSLYHVFVSFIADVKASSIS